MAEADAGKPEKVEAETPLPWSTMEPGETPIAADGVKPLVAMELPRAKPPAPRDDPSLSKDLKIKPAAPRAPLHVEIKPAAAAKKAAPAPTPVQVAASESSAHMRLVSEDLDDDQTPLPAARSSGWTIPMMCAGLAIIACCTLIPQTDGNRRMTYEKTKLQLDLDHLTRQVAVNKDFLKKINTDPALAERLAHRQMKMVREGTRVLDLDKGSKVEMNPFLLTAVGPPPELPPYQPKQGMLSRLFLNAKVRLYSTGLGLMLVAFGLVLGSVTQD